MIERLPMAAVAACLVLLTIGVAVAVAAAEPPRPTDRETAWTQWLAEQLGGEAEVPLFDRQLALRAGAVDIVTDEHAIEVEWLDDAKLAEAIDQARYYAVATGRKPAIITLRGRGPAKHEKLVFELFARVAALSGVKVVGVVDVNRPHLAVLRRVLRQPDPANGGQQ